MHNLDHQARRTYKCVVDKAVVYGLLDSVPMLLGEEGGRFDFNVKMVDARGILELVGNYANPRAFRCRLMFAKVLGRMETGARAQRSEQEFWRCHAFVMATVLRRRSLTMVCCLALISNCNAPRCSTVTSISASKNAKSSVEAYSSNHPGDRLHDSLLQCLTSECGVEMSPHQVAGAVQARFHGGA